MAGWCIKCCGVASLVAHSLARPCVGKATDQRRRGVEALLGGAAVPWRDLHVMGGSDMVVSSAKPQLGQELTGLRMQAFYERMRQRLSGAGSGSAGG